MKIFGPITVNFPNTPKGNAAVTYQTKSIYFDYPCSNSTDCEPYDIVIDPGIYFFELWGAAGGMDPFGKEIALGAYVGGRINIKKKQFFKLYIGGKGTDGVEAKYPQIGGYNGGGNGGYSGGGGGGATDLRLNELLTSRIIVAAGAAGGERAGNGHGGKFEGIQGQCGGGFTITHLSTPGTQTSGGFGGISKDGDGGNGTFGFGGNGDVVHQGGAGGGAGYYGGGATTYCCAGSGGSSFISGKEGCNAVTSETDLSPSGKSIHYSKIFFTNTKWYAGNETMPSRGTDLSKSFRQNEATNGAFRITILRNYQCATSKQRFLYPTILYMLFFLVMK